jgi:hypothetical protein
MQDKLTKSNVFSIDTGSKGGKLADYKMPNGIVSVGAMIPASVQAMMSTQFKSVGLNFDISKLAMTKDNRQALQELKLVVDMIRNNASLLPAFAAELKKAMSAAKKMADFNADMVKSALKTQHHIDEKQSEILLALCGYQSKTNTLKLKLERKVALILKTEAAKANFLNSSYGKQQELVDCQFEELLNVKLNQLQNREAQSKKRNERKIKNQDFLGSV